MVAAEKFDAERGFRFTTYATPWIKQSIRRAIDETGRSVRVPGRVMLMTRKIHEFESEFRGRQGRTPTPEEIADAFADVKSSCKITADWVREVMPAANSVISLDYRSKERVGDPASLADILVNKSDSPLQATHNKMQAVRRAQAIEDCLQQLDPRQRLIVKLRYGLNGLSPLTLKEVGEQLGISRERVRQLEAKALSQLEGSDLSKLFAPERSVE